MCHWELFIKEKQFVNTIILGIVLVKKKHTLLFAYDFTKSWLQSPVHDFFCFYYSR